MHRWTRPTLFTLLSVISSIPAPVGSSDAERTAAVSAKAAIDATRPLRLRPQFFYDDEIPPPIRRSAALALSKYWRLHRDILDGVAPQRYLVGQLRNGLGNRQQQAAAYLLMAMRTKRALLLDATDNHISHTPWPGGVFGDPFHLERHHEVLHRAQEAMQGSVDQAVSLHSMLCLPDGVPAGGLNASSVYLFPAPPESTLGFYPLAANAHHHPILRRTFGRWWDHFARRALFPLAPALQHSVKALQSRLFKEQEWVVGLHVRMGRAAIPHDKYVADAAATIARFVRCAMEAATEARGPVVFFVASDNAAAIEEIRTGLAGLGSRARVTHAPLKERAPDGDFATAAVDLALLQGCDDLVLTRGSSFSFAAHSGRLVAPILLSHDSDSCRRMRHSQASMQVAPWVMRDHPWHRELFEEESQGCSPRILLDQVADEYEEFD